MHGNHDCRAVKCWEFFSKRSTFLPASQRSATPIRPVPTAECPIGLSSGSSSAALDGYDFTPRPFTTAANDDFKSTDSCERGCLSTSKAGAAAEIAGENLQSSLPPLKGRFL